MMDLDDNYAHEGIFKGLAVVVGASGVPLATLLGAIFNDVAERRKSARLKAFALELKVELQGLKSTLNERLSVDEVQDIAERVVLGAANEPIENKRKMLAAILAGVFMEPVEVSTHLRFVRTVEVLSPFDILVLRAVTTVPHEKLNHSLKYSLMHILLDRVGKRTIEECEGSLHILGVHGLILPIDPAIFKTPRDAANAIDLRGFLTPFGKQFISYLR